MSDSLDLLRIRLAATGGRIVDPAGPDGIRCLVACLRGHETTARSRVIALHLRPDGSWTLAGCNVEAIEASEMPRLQEPWQVAPSAERWIMAWASGELDFTTLATGSAAESWETPLRAEPDTADHAWNGGSPEHPYFLTELGIRAIYRETIDGQECGWGSTSVVGLMPSSEGTRVLVEQADSRGDRWRFNVLVSPEGVAAEIRGSCDDLVVHDWIWRFPIEPRHWDEQQGPHGACMEIGPDGATVITEAGTFAGCVVMTARGEESAAQHWYHPLLGLVRSKFIDAEGREGCRDLVEIERLNLACQLPA